MEIVLFDLGGVLADFRGASALRELTDAATELEIWNRWLQSPCMRRFDSGQSTTAEFAREAVDEWQLPFTPERFVEEFRAWLVGPLEGADELVARTREHARVGCLSNINPVHWESWISAWTLAEHLDPRFLSYEIGAVKPDREIFQHVLRELDCDPGSVLFLDDNLPNVEAAQACGMQAAHARGVSEAQGALMARGILL